MSIIEYIFRVIAPHHCVGCGNEGSLLCTTCAEKLTPAPAVPTLPPLARVQAATAYESLSKELIHRLKFERASAAAEDIAALMAARLTFPKGVMLVHIPTAPARIRTRGYDQAQLIARALARRTGLMHAPLLARSGKQRQVGQDRATRQQQMKDAFYTPRAHAVKDRAIILVDDVLTTGSTCQAAAEILQKAGAAHVEAVVFAAAQQK